MSEDGKNMWYIYRLRDADRMYNRIYGDEFVTEI